MNLMGLRTALIHLLGGITRQESIENEAKAFDWGYHQATLQIKDCAESVNGKDSTEWRRIVLGRIGQQMTEASIAEKIHYDV